MQVEGAVVAIDVKRSTTRILTQKSRLADILDFEVWTSKLLWTHHNIYSPGNQERREMVLFFCMEKGKRICDAYS